MLGRKRHNKVLRVIFWIILFIIFCGVAIHLTFVFYLNSKISRDLQSEFSKQTKGEYELRIKKLETNIFTRSVTVCDFSVEPVHGVKPDATKFHISASKFSLSNFMLFEFLLKKNLRFYSLKLFDPEVTIFRNDVDKYDVDEPTSKNEKFSIYKLLKPHLKALSISEINVNNAEIRIYENDKDSLLILNSKDNELNIVGLHIDQESERVGRMFLADRTDLTIRKFAFTTKDSLYTIKVDKVSASYTGLSVVMDSISLHPNYSPSVFARRVKYQTDRFDISVSKIAFSDMDVKLFFEKNWFIAKHLEIMDLDLDAYRDKNIEREKKHKHSIQWLIRQIPVLIKVDTIRIKRGQCAYREVPEDATEPGRIYFRNVNATITGFTNRPSANGRPLMAVHASSRLMEHGRLRVYYGFPLNTDKMVFDCSGLLYGMPFTELNKVLEPIAKVSVSEGEVDSMDFSFHADEYQSIGKMKFLYHGLKAHILGKDYKPRQLDQVLSFLAHTFVLKESNPTRNQEPRITDIDYKRDPERFIFNYSLKSLLSGIKPAMGLPRWQIKKLLH
jgi:hypothetical protein